MAETPHQIAGIHGAGETRRDFLALATAGMGVVAVGASLIPLIHSMNPAADVLAAGGPIDIDISGVQPGQQIVVLWRSMPMFITHRTPDSVKTLSDPKLVGELRDPKSDVHQQPPYAINATRSAKPEYGVYVGICTHLGCIPKFLPNPSNTDPAPGWLGGFFCPCHGSKYDLAGRIYKSVPAPYNLPVPPHRFMDDKTLRIGENPAGSTFDLGSVVQL